MQSRSQFWTVSYRYRGQAKTHTSSALTQPETAARNWATATSWTWVTDVALTEHLTIKTDRPIRMEDLPGPGEPTLVPPCPAPVHEIRRFFRVQDYGPPMLPTGDHVRRFLSWVADGRARRTSPSPMFHGDIRFPDPVTLQVRDIRLILASRQIPRDRLPA
ncbi:hypothetical protein ACIO3O_38005 [Streptomyces sp. NPDC087440]|uniref:hypothetical protein n=1 Tax=Streptomyces sp. NPDC087440 TaxID=3365790 RepID=UPI00381B4531